MPDTLDPTQIVESLNADRIRQELAELHRREAALRVLLRSAVARDRHRQRCQEQEARGARQ